MLIYLLSLLAEESDRLILADMFALYDHLVRRIARGVLQNQYDAEDAAMAVWLKVLDHFTTAKAYFSNSRGDFESWLTVVTKNAARDECRRKKRAPQPIEMRDIPSTADTEKEAMKRMAAEVIQSMPDQFRIPLEMRMLGEYSFKEIGKSLGCSTGTAQRRFNQAYKVFGERFEARRG